MDGASPAQPRPPDRQESSPEPMAGADAADRVTTPPPPPKSHPNSYGHNRPARYNHDLTQVG